MNHILQKPLSLLHSQTSAKQYSASNHEDEIDLIALFLMLWQQKRQIIAITCISTLFAGVYAFAAAEQWTVKAFIYPPRIAQIADYLNLRRAFSRVSGTGADVQGLSQSLFNEFTAMAASPDEKMQYLSTTEYFTEQTQGMDEQEKRLWLSEMSEKKLTLIPPDEKKNYHYFVLSMTAGDPVTANRLLENYVKTVNNKVIIQDDSEFRDSLAAIIQSRKKEKQDIEFKANAEQKSHLSALEQALSTAQGAGIKDYYANSIGQGSTKIELANSIYRYMLGENYLRAEIRSLKNSPVIYPVRYYEIERELAMLTPLLLQQTVAQAYRYKLTPSEYVKKDQPKRAIIITLGAILGLMFGTGWVLINSQIKQYQSGKQDSSTI